MLDGSARGRGDRSRVAESGDIQCAEQTVVRWGWRKAKGLLGKMLEAHRCYSTGIKRAFLWLEPVSCISNLSRICYAHVSKVFPRAKKSA